MCSEQFLGFADLRPWLEKAVFRSPGYRPDNAAGSSLQENTTSCGDGYFAVASEQGY